MANEDSEYEKLLDAIPDFAKSSKVVFNTGRAFSMMQRIRLYGFLRSSVNSGLPEGESANRAVACLRAMLAYIISLPTWVFKIIEFELNRWSDAVHYFLQSSNRRVSDVALCLTTLSYARLQSKEFPLTSDEDLIASSRRCRDYTLQMPGDDKGEQPSKVQPFELLLARIIDIERPFWEALNGQTYISPAQDTTFTVQLKLKSCC